MLDSCMIRIKFEETCQRCYGGITPTSLVSRSIYNVVLSCVRMRACMNSILVDVSVTC